MNDLAYFDQCVAFAERCPDPAQRKLALDEARSALDRLARADHDVRPACPAERPASQRRDVLLARLRSGRGGVERAGTGRTLADARWSTWETTPAGQMRRVR